MPIILDEVMIQIPVPRPTQNLNRGYLKPVPKTKPATIRFNKEDKDAVRKCAAALGMSFGEFTRWSCVYAAIAVNNMIAVKQYEAKQSKKTQEIDTSDYT